MPSEEEKLRASQAKHSLINILRRLDIFSKFKVIVEIQGISLSKALREAVSDYIQKYNK